MAAVGSGNVTVKSAVSDGTNTVYTLDYQPTGTIQTAITSATAAANPLRILPNPLLISKLILSLQRAWLKVLMRFFILIKLS
jgi:hypothetical protein